MAMSPFGLLGHELQTNLQDSLPALAAAWKFHDHGDQTRQTNAFKHQFLMCIGTT